MTAQAQSLLKSILDFQVDNNRQQFLNYLALHGLIPIADVQQYQDLPTTMDPSGTQNDPLHLYIGQLVQGGHLSILLPVVKAWRYDSGAPNYTALKKYYDQYTANLAALKALPKQHLTAGSDIATS